MKHFPATGCWLLAAGFYWSIEIFMADLPLREPVFYRICPAVGNDQLNALFFAAWPAHTAGDFQPVLRRSLAYVCAYTSAELIGFANLAWDGGVHAFLLDPTVHPARQRQGIGSALVRQAIGLARDRGASWLHVDYEPHLERFYRSCGFQPTAAGLLRLTEK